MIKIPIEDIYAKIREKASITDQEIDEKINLKLKQLSGLISREGAAHIIANELGVKLFDAVSGRLQIKNILAGMRSVETVGRVKQIYETREFKTENRTGKVGSFILADDTGFIRIVCWGDMADNLKKMRDNDVIKIKGGYVRNNQGRKEVHMNEKGILIISPKDETIAEINEIGAVRKEIKNLTEGDSNVEVLATIVQIYNPTFFDVCPECRKKVVINSDQATCDNHGNVIPKTSFVVNAVIDDGTEDMRAIFFGEQANMLTNKLPDEFIKIRENPGIFEQEKTKLMGKIVKINGRITRNKMFDRLELIANNINLNPDPEDELKRLNEEAEKAKLT